MHILGISCFYHDAAAAILKENKILAAAEEERFSRKKHDFSFPKNAINYCLKEAGITAKELDYIVFHEKPFIKFERIIQTHLATWPRSYLTFIKAIPLWLNQKLWIQEIIKKETGFKGTVLFSSHHLSHAASAYLVSGFKEAAILTVDGVGEWMTTMKGFGRNSEISMTKAINFPHSLGLLYSAFTAFLGFEVNEGEYKVMGMAPYGQPKYIDKIMKLIDAKEDGSFHLDMSYFAYHRSFESFSKKFIEEFGNPRIPESKFDLNDEKDRYYADIAASIQRVLEEILLRMVRKLHEETKCGNLCMAGGVALNCTANGRILRETPFKNIFIQPASGDCGAALGAAVYVYNSVLKKSPAVQFETPYLGPSYSSEYIEKILAPYNVSCDPTQKSCPETHDTGLAEKNIKYEKLSDVDLVKKIADLLAHGKIVGFYHGRMEWGPRALGNRSILADPRNPKMKDIVNEKIKHREAFRPFAPSVLEEYAKDYFEIDNLVPATSYMLITYNVRKEKQDIIPAVTHANGTARIQTVRKEQNPRYYDLISEFHKLTGVPVVLNTSFNVRGEPIVENPEQALNCFFKTDIDILVLENFVIEKYSKTAAKDINS